MDTFVGLVIWAASVAAAFLMADKRGRDTRWAIVGGLLFGWFAPLYYLIAGDSKELKEQKLADAIARITGNDR